jgi:hypothetical protein
VANGVFAEPTSAGRCALAIPLDYLDTSGNWGAGPCMLKVGRLILDPTMLRN